MSTIPRGKRYRTLYKRASDLSHDGATLEQIERTIRYMNRFHCEPPLSEGNIRQLVRTISKWPSLNKQNGRDHEH